MKKIIENYKSTLIMLASIVIGVICGIIFKEKTEVVKPLGDLFLNLLFVIIVPIIFLTITTTISKMNSPKRLGKVLSSIIIIFIITSLVAVFIGIVSSKSINLVDQADKEKIVEIFDSEEKETTELNILDSTVKLISVNDFNLLLSKNNVVAIVLFSILFGLAIRMSKEKGKDLLKVLNSLNDVIFNLLKIIMYYAPIGIGCYFAALIGTLGTSIAIGFLKTFVVYTIVSILYFVIIYGLYALIAGGKNGLKAYFKYIINPTLTALATCSSAASIPVNIKASKSIGVDDDICETIIPLGTSLHKDGSIIGSVFKIMFLVYLFGDSPSLGKIIIVSLIANLLITAVPIGGGSVSETLILSMMGYPIAALPVLTIIATIIDPPATMLNVVGDSASSMLVQKILDKNHWKKKKTSYEVNPK